MIRRLRLKFIAVTMGVTLLAFSSLFLMLNALMSRYSERQTDQLLMAVAQQDGLLQPQRLLEQYREWRMDAPVLPAPEMMRAGRYFYVKLDGGGGILEVNLEMMWGFTRDEALEHVGTALSRQRERGRIDNMRYLVAPKSYGSIVVFAQRGIESLLLELLISISAKVAGGTFLALLIISLFLSKWVVKPVSDAFQKQRRFISDASHELKTPLAILSANADLLENETGQNVRLEHMKEQTRRMNLLIHDLLRLAKTDEGGDKLIMGEFDLSRAVTSCALEFESRAFEENKRYLAEIEKNIFAVGDEEQTKRLAAILIDNAIRYSDRSGEIRVSLKTEGARTHLSVYNTGPGIPDNEREKVFDRFYRSDESRSRETGGYGLGLAIAKSIVQAHRWKIKIDGKTGEWVRFTVIIQKPAAS